METMFLTGYSYKGGVGRSTALANIACLLAEDEDHPQRVLLWDFDLEAPGVHRLFPSKESWHRGFVDLAYHFASTEKLADPSDFVYQSNVPGVDVLPAGIVGEDYCDKLSQIDWPSFFGDDPKERGPFFDRLVEWIKEAEYDYVFIDSRTGLSDVAGICTQVLPDALLMFFRLTDQNIDGISHLVPVIRGQLASRGREDVDVLPIVSPVLSQSSDTVVDLRERACEIFDVKELKYIRFDADLVAEERLFCLNRIKSQLWPEPPIVGDYRHLSNVIRGLNPHDTRTLYNTLRRTMRERDFATARRRISGLIRRRPNSPDSWRYLRTVCRNTPKGHEFGDELADECARKGERNVFTLEWDAAKHVEKAGFSAGKELDSAIECLQEAAKLAPNRRTVYRWLSEIGSCTGDLELATRSLEKLHETTSDSLQGVLDLANLYVRRGRDYFMLARKALEPRAKELQTPLLVYLWSFYQDESNAARAMEELRQASELGGRGQYLRVVEAYSTLLLGKEAIARSIADEALAADPGGDVTNWAEFFICLGDCEKAVSLLESTESPTMDEDASLETGQYNGLKRLAQYLRPSQHEIKKEDVSREWGTPLWNFTELIFYREHSLRTESYQHPDRLSVIEKLIQICSLALPRGDESVFWRCAPSGPRVSIEGRGSQLTVRIEP